jgi:hypothetical protein
MYNSAVDMEALASGRRDNILSCPWLIPVPSRKLSSSKFTGRCLGSNVCSWRWK